jgi:hypothetical protein
MHVRHHQPNKLLLFVDIIVVAEVHLVRQEINHSLTRGEKEVQQIGKSPVEW